ncbi:hypothetical protein [Trinickia terrae]|nr:hypothetical protein [Trinickia terrae]
MATGGGPTPEQWARMSKKQKTVYWVFIAVIAVMIGSAVIEKLLS